MACRVLCFDGLAEQCPTALGRQMQPHICALRDSVGGGGDNTKLRAVRRLDHIVPAVAEKDCPGPGPATPVLAPPPGGRRERNLVWANRHRRIGALPQCTSGA